MIKDSSEYQDIILSCTKVAELGGYELEICIRVEEFIPTLVSDGFILHKRNEDYVIKW